MNQTPRIVPAAPGGDEQPSDQSPDPQSTPPERSGNRPSLLRRVADLFRPRNASLREDLAGALAEHDEDANAFSPAERAMLHNILRLRELRVEDVMIPRVDIVAIEATTTLGELLELFEQSGHSRMPVYEETLDDPRGMVHIRDLVSHFARAARQEAAGPDRPAAGAGLFDLARVDLSKTVAEADLIRPVLFVPPSMPASDLMARMQAAHIQMALVIDEYGGTDGLASLEDIVEMVVGDIEDEHDTEEPLIERAGDGAFLVDAKAEIEEVAEVIGEAFRLAERAGDVDTIGGLVFEALGRVPAKGEIVRPVAGFEFQVLDADPRRVKRVRIVQVPAGEEPGASDERAFPSK